MSQEPILFTGVERQELDDFTVQLGQLPLGELEWLRRHHSLQPPDEVIAYIAAHWQELATLIASRLLEREPDAADADQHRTFVRKTAFWRRKLALIEGEMERRRQAARSPPPEEPAASDVAIEVGSTAAPVANLAKAPDADTAQASEEPAARPATRARHWRQPAPQRESGRERASSAEAAGGNGSKATDSTLVDELSTVAAAQPGHEGDRS